MEKPQLKSVARNLETQTPEKVRKQGLIPAELYGNKIANAHVSVAQNEFEKLLRKAGESTIIELVTEDGAMHNVLIHDVQRHYLTNRPIHVDFYEVSMTEKLKTEVQLEFIGESSAVKLLAGTLVKVLDAVEVECLPGDLPHSIEVDISVLKNFEQQILVKDLKVSDKVEILADPEEVIATVQPPRDVEAELAQEANFDVSQVEGAAETPLEPTDGEAAVEPAEEK